MMMNSCAEAPMPTFLSLCQQLPLTIHQNTTEKRNKCAFSPAGLLYFPLLAWLHCAVPSCVIQRCTIVKVPALTFSGGTM